MASGDIWSTGAFNFESPLKDLLDSLEFSLVDLLAENELLQELRGLHPQLVSFFSTEENVAELVRWLVRPTPAFEDVVEKDASGPAHKDDAHKDEKKQVEEEEKISEAHGGSIGQEENSDIESGPAEPESESEPETEPEPEPNLDDIDISRDTIESQDFDSPGNFLLENTTEPIESNKRTSVIVRNREDYEMVYIRFPFMACEVICCEVPTILDILVEGHVPIKREEDGADIDPVSSQSQTSGADDRQSILDLLFSVLFNTPSSQLDDRRAGYLEKILTMLFRKKRTELTTYINGDHLRTNKNDDEEIDANEEDTQNGDEDTLFARHKGGGKQFLEGLFNHLYSNSISQILQRLLMPRPPSYGSDPGEESNDEGSHDEWPLHADDDDDEDGELEEYGGINCDWADSEIGLNLLLNQLMVVSTTSYSEDEEEIKLNASQHACEILTTVIQHSPLSSNVMKKMTGGEILDRLIKCACGTTEGSAPADFSMHDSTMTTAMNVLEILILQLGGYGTVPTGIPNCDFDEVDMNDNNESGNDGAKPTGGLMSTLEPSKETEAQDLIRKLPDFLSCLCNLLKHSDTSNWTSQVQYSNRPQLMLGASRLRIVRLIESLVLLSIRDIDSFLCDSECLHICLDLFWAFPWCSMLHQSVANLLVHVLEGGEDRVDLQIYFLTRCNLPKRLIDSFEKAGALFSSGDDREEVEKEAESNGEYSTTIAIKDSTIIAMKGICTNSEPSSTGGEQGSVSSANGIDLPVSDDDVDAAIEQEEQKMKNGGSTKLDNEQSLEQINTADKTGDKKSNISTNATAFRMGYMGHVIIICQALVHACGNMETGANEETPEVVTAELSNNYSPTKDYGPTKAEKIPNGAASEDVPPRRNMICSLLRGNPHYFIWMNFVTTTLASETAVQSTPLGGYNAQEEMNGGEEHHTGTSWESNHYVNDSHKNHYVVSSDEIEKLDETELDIATTLMESMSITPGNSATNDDGPGSTHGHRRQRGVMGGSGIGNFGTVVEFPEKPDEYQYDDPFGSKLRDFDDEGDGDHFEDIDGDGDHFEDTDGDGSSNDSSDDDSDNDNDNGDDSPPEINLFVGKFNFPGANESDDAGGWANFDDAFSAVEAEFPSPVVDESPPVFGEYTDQTSAHNVFGMVANNANIMSSFGDLKNQLKNNEREDLFNNTIPGEAIRNDGATNDDKDKLQ